MTSTINSEAVEDDAARGYAAKGTSMESADEDPSPLPWSSFRIESDRTIAAANGCSSLGMSPFVLALFRCQRLHRWATPSVIPDLVLPAAIDMEYSISVNQFGSHLDNEGLLGDVARRAAVARFADGCVYSVSGTTASNHKVMLALSEFARGMVFDVRGVRKDNHHDTPQSSASTTTPHLTCSAAHYDPNSIHHEDDGRRWDAAATTPSTSPQQQESLPHLISITHHSSSQITALKLGESGSGGTGAAGRFAQRPLNDAVGSPTGETGRPVVLACRNVHHSVVHASALYGMPVVFLTDQIMDAKFEAILPPSASTIRDALIKMRRHHSFFRHKSADEETSSPAATAAFGSISSSSPQPLDPTTAPPHRIHHHHRHHRAPSHDVPFAVLVTSPTYEGFIADIAAISAVTREFGVFLWVDQAWGSHLGYDASGEHVPFSAMQLGADIVTESLHKTGGGLQGSSVLLWKQQPQEHHKSEGGGGKVERARDNADGAHRDKGGAAASIVPSVGCAGIPEDLVLEVMLAHRQVESTSPNFEIIASIDACLHRLSRDASPVIRCVDKIQELTRGFRALNDVWAERIAVPPRGADASDQPPVIFELHGNNPPLATAAAERPADRNGTAQRSSLSQAGPPLPPLFNVLTEVTSFHRQASGDGVRLDPVRVCVSLSPQARTLLLRGLNDHHRHRRPTVTRPNQTVPSPTAVGSRVDGGDHANDEEEEESTDADDATMAATMPHFSVWMELCGGVTLEKVGLNTMLFIATFQLPDTAPRRVLELFNRRLQKGWARRANVKEDAAWVSRQASCEQIMTEMPLGFSDDHDNCDDDTGGGLVTADDVGGLNANRDAAAAEVFSGDAKVMKNEKKNAGGLSDQEGKAMRSTAAAQITLTTPMGTTQSKPIFKIEGVGVGRVVDMPSGYLPRVVDAARAVGAVANEVVECYPPGIPVITVGYRITAEQVRYLVAMQRAGAHIVAADRSLRTFRVRVPREEEQAGSESS